MVRCKAYFDIFNHLCLTHEFDRQTDVWIDILTANATVNYDVWQNKKNQKKDKKIGANFLINCINKSQV